MTGIRSRIIAEQKLQFEEFDLPSSLKPTQVLVKAERTIISADTELANYTGLEPATRVEGSWCCYPWTPGYGGIGRVVARGDRVTQLDDGARVYAILQHATHTIVDTAAAICIPVPEGLDPTTAAFARMGSVAITAYRRAQPSLGDTVAIIGLGLVGNLAGQFFLAGGIQTIGIDLSERRRSSARKCGFHEAIDPSGMSVQELTAQLRQLTMGKLRPNVVIDAVGDSRLVEMAVQLVENNGQVVLLGSPRAPYQADCTDILKEVHLRGIELKGALEWIVPMLKRQSPGVTTEKNGELILEMLASGQLRVKDLCTHVIPPADLNAAYQGLLHQKNEYVGVVLDWENHPAPAAERSTGA